VISIHLAAEGPQIEGDSIMRLAILSALTMTILMGATPLAQAPSGTGTIELTAAEIQTMVKLGVNNPMKSIDAGKHNVVLVMETRKQTSQAGNGISHAEITEVYLIVAGSAMLRTGGRLKDSYTLYDGGRGGPLHGGPLPGVPGVPRFPSPTLTGTPEGGVTRKVNVGDMIVIPPNTVHTWDSIDSPSLSYITIRVDPEHRLYAGYTHPDLKR
jgi:mannose-6-phosphate isomerase-like protein (cupin superfamily)